MWGLPMTMPAAYESLGDAKSGILGGSDWHHLS
jgi:hypothetical protein